MSGQPTLSDTSKLEAINYGLEPKLTSKDHGPFDAQVLFDALEKGDGIVSFPGIHLRHGFEDETIIQTRLGDPFLIRKAQEGEKKFLEIYPFNPSEPGTGENRFSFDLNRWTIQVRKEVSGANLHSLFLAKPGHYIFLATLDMQEMDYGLKTVIFPRMPAREIHQRYLEQLAEMHRLRSRDHDKKEYGDVVWHHQRFRGPNGREFEVRLPERSGEMSHYSKDIHVAVETGQSELVRILDRSPLSFREEHKGQKVYTLKPTFYQTPTVDRVVQAMVSYSHP